MKMKTVVNTLIISSILLILYIFVGHDFVEFYFGGKKDILQTAAHINDQCNANGSCPLTLENWSGEKGRLKSGRKMYITIPDPVNENNENSLKPKSFRLIYVMTFPPDDWFEVQGGVGKNVTSGWTGR